jgi:Protein of unknown function (DUF2958)
MTILTQSIIKQIPPLHTNAEVDNEGKIIIYAKYFLPGNGRWACYIAEYDPDSQIAFGYIVSDLDSAYDKWDYFSLKDLQEVRTTAGIVGLAVERDLYFSPKAWKDIKQDRD